MSNIARLQKALQRSGIRVEYNNGIYQLNNDAAEARILLPATLPLEEKAVKQLMEFAAVHNPQGHQGVCKACATPDFHPGSIAPVGSVVATDPDFVIPAAIGTDINCGMRLITTGLTESSLAAHQEALVSKLTRALLQNGRDIPVRSEAYRALFGESPAAFIDKLTHQGLWASVDRSRLLQELEPCIGLESFGAKVQYAPAGLTGSRELLRDPSLGTPGGGNHFVELQVVDEVFDRHAAYAAGLAKGDIVVMIHSGSRDVGFFVGQRWMDKAREAWPVGLKHPKSGLYGLVGPLAEEYLSAMGVAARYAWANRVVLAEMVRKEIAQVTGSTASRLVVDVPHNVILQEHGMNIHRKGATPAHGGDLVLIPGSMGDFSYMATGLGHPDWLWSCSHGAGRKVRRQVVRRMHQEASPGAWQCVTLREERRVEEAPQAYKPIGAVIESQEVAGLIRGGVRMRPLVTFKA